MSQKSVAIVTGGTSGIGLETAKALLGKGFTVYTLSRRPSNAEGLIHICVDISDETKVVDVIDKINHTEGQIDLLINNAGFGISGAIEFTENNDAKHLLDVNLFGVVNGCKAVIPIMRNQGHGRIINISSVAAVAPIPFQAWYSISKSSVSSFSMALANELRGTGIEVCSILPGDISSGFTAAREKNSSGDDVYFGRISKSVAKMEKDEQSGMSPSIAGSYIAGIATKRRLKPEYSIGFSYKVLTVLARILPSNIKQCIIGILYA